MGSKYRPKSPQLANLQSKQELEATLRRMRKVWSAVQEARRKEPKGKESETTP